MPSSISLSLIYAGPPVQYIVAYSAPEGTAFRVVASAARLHVTPDSGVGPATLQVLVDPADFPIGRSMESFQVISDGGTATVAVWVQESLGRRPPPQNRPNTRGGPKSHHWSAPASR